MPTPTLPFDLLRTLTLLLRIGQRPETILRACAATAGSDRRTMTAIREMVASGGKRRRER